MPTKIEWCDEVWNVVTGCTKVNDGCKFCYAERIMNNKRYNFKQKFTDVRAHPTRLNIPYKWKKPRRIFVCSMGDLFHEAVPFDFIWQDVFGVIEDCKRHTFLILTKRPQRINDFLDYVSKDLSKNIDFPENVWLGVSVEDQPTADERIPILLQVPAAKHFVSYEPALGPIDLKIFSGEYHEDIKNNKIVYHYMIDDIDWVIAGCESGPHRRSAKIDWFKSLRDQCEAAKVPFFLKQAENYYTKKIIKMPYFGGKTWDQIPERLR